MQTNLQLNNPAGIEDAVFGKYLLQCQFNCVFTNFHPSGLLGDAAAAAGQGSITV